MFTSIAFSLIQRIQSGDTLTTQCSLALGVPVDHIQDLNYIQKLLRLKMVEEWNNNHEHYQGFITTDITTVAHEYLQSGQFLGCTGDLMVLTLANILQMPITVFTSVSNMPVLCIMPTTHSTLTTQLIFLAYTQTGPGHYDCVLPIESSDSAKTKPKKNKIYLWKKPKEP